MVWIIRAKDNKGDTVFWSKSGMGMEWRQHPVHCIATYYDKSVIREYLAYLTREEVVSGSVTDVQAVNLSAYPIG